MKKALLKNIEHMDTASWLRSLSDDQTNALRTLRNALRDDILQESYYRTEQLLDKIGVLPPMPVKRLKRFIALSRANDLAFLYFILEGYYKVSQRGEGYTNSEKLLMTSILALDIVFTVKALDLILPPKNSEIPRHEKIVKEFQLEEDGDKKPSPELKKNYKCKLNKSPTSPYFQKLLRPERIKVETVFSQKNRKVEADFSFWRSGKEPNYEVKNENRWFANYQLKPSHRVVHKELKRTVKCLLDHMDLSVGLADDPGIMCEHHKQWSEDKRLVRDAFIVAADRACERFIKERYADKKRRAEVLKKLEEDINWYTEKYKRITQMQLTPIQMISRTCPNACDQCHKALIRTQAKVSENMRMLCNDKDIKRLHAMSTNTVKTISGRYNTLKELNLKKSTSSLKAWPHKRVPRKHSLSALDGCKVINVDDENEMNVLKEAKYFTSPTAHTPFKFEYNKIFPNKTHNKLTFSENLTIRRAFVKVLRTKQKSVVYGSKSITAPCLSSSQASGCSIVSIMNDENQSDDELEENKANIFKAVIECAEDIIRQNLRILDPERLYRKLKAASNRSIGIFQSELVPLVYDDIDYFDPNNDHLMDRLLEDGIDALRADKRFVVAYFPNAEKLPVLREWIKRRYGKKYTYKELQKSVKESGRIFQTCLKLHGREAAVPLMGMTGNVISYSARDEMFKLGMQVKQNYVASLNERLYENMRYCWMAMGGNLVDQAKTGKLFYTYLPAKDNEILRFRPWNGEFRDYKKFRAELARKEADRCKGLL